VTVWCGTGLNVPLIRLLRSTFSHRGGEGFAHIRQCTSPQSLPAPKTRGNLPDAALHRGSVWPPELHGKGGRRRRTGSGDPRDGTPRRGRPGADTSAVFRGRRRTLRSAAVCRLWPAPVRSRAGRDGRATSRGTRTPRGALWRAPHTTRSEVLPEAPRIPP
jgi:hypothetical protein